MQIKTGSVFLNTFPVNYIKADRLQQCKRISNLEKHSGLLTRIYSMIVLYQKFADGGLSLLN